MFEALLSLIELGPNHPELARLCFQPAVSHFHPVVPGTPCGSVILGHRQSLDPQHLGMLKACHQMRVGLEEYGLLDLAASVAAPGSRLKTFDGLGSMVIPESMKALLAADGVSILARA